MSLPEFEESTLYDPPLLLSKSLFKSKSEKQDKRFLLTISSHSTRSASSCSGWLHSMDLRHRLTSHRRFVHGQQAALLSFWEVPILTPASEPTQAATYFIVEEGNVCPAHPRLVEGTAHRSFNRPEFIRSAPILYHPGDEGRSRYHRGLSIGH